MYPKPTDILPHRPPFLMLDEVTECSDKLVCALKIFHSDDYFFRGHFPDRPIVPGVILLEGMAQALAYQDIYTTEPKLVLMVGVEKARFRRPVLPEQQVEFQVSIEGRRMGMLFGVGKAICNGKTVATGRFIGARETVK